VRDIKPDTPSNTYVIYGLDDYTPATHSKQHLLGDTVSGCSLGVLCEEDHLG
jgi:hypothetical protein